jgi:hypothetical protein
MPSFPDMFNQHVVICAKFVIMKRENTDFSFFSVDGSVKKLCVSAYGVFCTICMVYFTEVLVCMQQDFLQKFKFCIASLVPRNFRASFLSL